MFKVTGGKCFFSAKNGSEINKGGYFLYLLSSLCKSDQRDLN